MAKGRKSGGRTKGTPNRATLDLAERLEALGCDPIEGMARIAINPKTSPELRGRMYSELCQYVHAKRKATELKVELAKSSNSKEDLCQIARGIMFLLEAAKREEKTIEATEVLPALIQDDSGS